MDVKEYDIKHANNKYFQKSTFFLYPLLKIPKGVIPIITYLCWDTLYVLEDMVLICKYKKFEGDKQLQIEKDYLIKHPFYINSYQYDQDNVIYVFDFKKFNFILLLFKEGKYSLFPDKIKQIIISFYKEGSYTKAYINTYLYPNKYYNKYADLLNVQLLLLINTVELIDIPDMKKEELN